MIAWRDRGRSAEAHDRTTCREAMDAQQRLRRGTSEDHERLLIWTIEHNEALLGPRGPFWGRYLSCLVLSCPVLSWRRLLAGGRGNGGGIISVLVMRV